MMAWDAQSEQRKRNTYDQWDQHVFRPNKRPTPNYRDNEPLNSYRKHLMDAARPLVAPDLQKVKVEDLFDTSLDHYEKAFFESAVSELRAPTNVPEGKLKEVVSYDQAGRPSYTYWGSPSVWMSAFAAPKKKLTGINASLNFTKV
jgi:hypothetical protein